MAPTTLGKRKERESTVKTEEEGAGDGADTSNQGTDKHSSTLFVSNLPYAATSTDLQTLFSDIAPVRSAFVVTQQGTGVSKGVGYVSFAIKEDAQGAYDKIAAEGIKLNGRALRVEWADTKKHVPREKDDSKPAADKPKALHPPKAPRTPISHDPNAIRTIVISGFPSSIDQKTLWKKVRKYDGAESVQWPASVGGAEDKSTAEAIFKTPAAATNAVTKLHAHVFKGALLSVTLKKRLESLLSKPVKAKAASSDAKGKVSASTSTAPTHASRLIVRNLPFDITEQDLRAIFLPYGPIYSITIPSASAPTTGEDADGKRTSGKKGFAFVWMMSKKDAERALAGCNGMKVAAGIARELAERKQKRKKEIRLEKQNRALAKGKPVDGEDAEADEEEEEGEKDEEESDEEDEEAKATYSRKRERVIAVDWALSKDRWEEEKAKLEEAGEASASGSDSDFDASDDSDSDGESSNSHVGVHDDDDDDVSESEDEGSDVERDEDEEAPVKPTLPDTDVGTTLFIRNVPYDATEDELRTLFRAFGPLRYARITKDPETGRGRGTGFACYWNKEDADKVILQFDTLRAETQALPTTLPKPNPFTLPSLLTPDPSSSLAQSLVLHGRTLDVVRAVTRSTADKLREDGLKRREKADKRHAYLLREGVILPNMSAAASLAPADLERRTNSYNARRKLLQSNPSLYISRTRLSVRQLPLFATERMLKRLAMHAVRAFEDEVKAGQREALTADELEERDEEADAAALNPANATQSTSEDAPPKKRGKFTGRPQRVKQTKVIRQAERVDAVTGRARSKGYGFIEMSTHADALRVLRWANNNGALAPLWREWWLDEVKDLAEKERKKPAGEKDETRLKRLEDELKMGAAAQKARGTLIVEFSIENVQVVKRRQEKVSGGGKDGAEGKRGHKKDSEDVERPSKRRRTDDEDERPSRTKQGLGGKRDRRDSTSGKKPTGPKDKAKRSSTNGDEDAPRKKARVADTGSEGGKDGEKTKEGGKAPNPLGSIIGRKRKERKKKGGKA